MVMNDTNNWEIDDNGYITFYDKSTKRVTYEFNMIGNETMTVELKDDIVVSVQYSEEWYAPEYKTPKFGTWVAPEAKWKECDHIVVVNKVQPFGTPRSYCRLCGKSFTNEEWLEFAGPKPTCIKCGKTMWQYGKHKMICHGEGCDYTIDHESGTPYPKTPLSFESKIQDLEIKLHTKIQTIALKNIRISELEDNLKASDNQITGLISDLCGRATDMAQLQDMASDAFRAWREWTKEYSLRNSIGVSHMSNDHLFNIDSLMETLKRKLKK